MSSKVSANRITLRALLATGKTLVLPLVHREIPLLADAAVDKEFGTGALKVTPGHDPVDFEIGKRHDLPQLDVMSSAASAAPPREPVRAVDMGDSSSRRIRHPVDPAQPAPGLDAPDRPAPSLLAAAQLAP